MNGAHTPSFSHRIPEGDDRERLVCNHCGFVQYENPKILVGSVVVRNGKVLLCRRAIEPRDGYWTLPAGFLELGEEPEQGARREAWEEARARLSIDRLLGIYSIIRISQVQLIYRATLTDERVSPGPESREVARFSFDEIPWSELAFPSVRWALEDFQKTRDVNAFSPLSRCDAGEGGL